MVFEAFDPKTVLVFDRRTIADVCAALGKRHANQDVVLQLTRSNYRRLLDKRDDFAALGVVVTELTSLPN